MKKTVLFLGLIISYFSVNAQYDINGNYSISGNLGIGVIDTDKKLDIQGPLRIRGDYATLYFYRNTGATDIAKIRYEEPNQKFIIGANNKDIVFSSKLNFGESMKISSNGNVSIYGSANIGGSINITGDILANSLETQGYLTAGGAARIKGEFATLYFNRGTEGDDIAKIRYEESNLRFIIGANNKDIIFCSKLGYGESMRITPQGNIGIGTTETGTHKLAVEGTIGAREIKVEADGWSDFVFNKDYMLKDLEEVESFIEENNHLPDVPSEKDVLENGIQLGEMDATLLQKIEELTLYMIEQNKRTNKLVEEVQGLKVENELLKEKISILKPQ